MNKVLQTLDGKKTYIVAVVIALLNLAVAFDVLTVEQINAINAVLVGLGLGALRQGVKKS